MLSSCQKNKGVRQVGLSDFAELRTSKYEISDDRIFTDIKRLISREESQCIADIHTRRHYIHTTEMLWITRSGVSVNADSLLACVSRVDTLGLSREYFYYTQLKDDLNRVRRLNFDSVSHSYNSAVKVFARLEYYLTKSFLRYTEGQRFGFMNPYSAFNQLDQRKEDTLRVSYRSLYGWNTKIPNDKFLAVAQGVIKGDPVSFSDYLRASRPSDPLYYKFVNELNGRPLTKNNRKRLLCNIERCRWINNGDYPQKHKKYVVVNIPALRLFAHNGEESLTMKIGVGSLETKTPLLSSRIKRMDFNPQWVIPKSIVKSSVLHHVGNHSYFDSHNYFVRERSTGRIVDIENVTRDMLLSSSYSVVQWGGRGNALGRVIFRFDNDYSIYLHDTSSRDVFSRTNRTVSHGCIRVEKPYELAVFMLNERDEALEEKMKYSMTADFSERPIAYEENAEKPDKKKMVRSLKVEPSVPIYIAYFTMYPDIDGNIVSYDDLYGYDDVIYTRIKNVLSVK